MNHFDEGSDANASIVVGEYVKKLEEKYLKLVQTLKKREEEEEAGGNEVFSLEELSARYE